MDLKQIPLFGLLKKRMEWQGQRQEVLAQNIANADTPGYRSKDLKPFKFRELIRRQNMQINMDASGPNFMGGERKRIVDFDSQTERKPFETSPDGNAVVLEEQTAKLNENAIGYKLSSELYRKNLSMIQIAIGKR